MAHRSVEKKTWCRLGSSFTCLPLGILVSVGVFAGLAAHVSGEDRIELPVESQTTIARLKPDISKISGDFKLEIFYFNKGTRSERVHGSLFVKGKEAFGESLEEEIQTPLGVYVWHGSWRDRKPLGASGWMPKDLSSVFPSWGAKAKQGG